MAFSSLPGVGVSRLGFGLMRLPLAENGRIDREAAAGMVDLAYQSGVRYFDTAYGYHDGESEEFAGEALGRYPRESFLLADKLPCWFLKTREDPARLFEVQLQRCRVQYFDYYLLHSLAAENWRRVLATDAYCFARKLKSQGRIRHLGFSYHGDYDTFLEVLDHGPWDFVQLQVNYIDYVMSDAKAYCDELLRRDIPCVVMEPVRGGFLANLPEVARKELDAVNSEPSARWALRWFFDRPGMPMILSGMSTPRQLQDNLDTFAEHRPLSPREKAALDKARDAVLHIKTVPCTGCRYCMECPSNVDIPGVIGLFNEYKLFQNAYRTKDQYASLGNRTGDHCVNCGQCSEKCPQNIDIPSVLSDIHDQISGLHFPMVE